MVPTDLSDCIVRIYYREDDAGSLTQIAATGFLASRSYILTCAHVITAALGIEEEKSSHDLDLVGERISVGIGIANPAKVLAEVVAWYPVAEVALADIAVLKLERPYSGAAGVAQNWMEPEMRGQVSLFGFGYDPEKQLCIDQGRWIDGECKGPLGNHQIQIDCPEREVLPGFSGCPVFNVERNRVLGMLVAREPGEKIAHMIPTQQLQMVLPFEEEREASLIDCLFRMLNRFEQMACLGDRARQPTNFHCFVVQSRGKDLPGYLAEKYKMLLHMDKDGLSSVEQSLQSVRHITAGSFAQAGFKQLLEENLLGRRIEEWLEYAQGPKVVTFSSVRTGKTVAQIESVLSEFKRLDQAQLQLRHPFFVIIPYNADELDQGKKMIMHLRLWKRKLSKKFLTILPPLTAIKEDDLRGFMADMPQRAQVHFKQKFCCENLAQSLAQCLPDSKPLSYEEVKPHFSNVLRDSRERHLKKFGE